CLSRDASADWTTFDTIGGYALEKDGALRFRPGVFLAAVERWQWLLIDELNRADVDRAFGELMTVLAGGTSDSAYQLPDGRLVSVGSRANCSHRLPRTFRVLTTMNTWDKTSLFRLSYAVQRRFAIIHVGIPDDATYASLIDHHADRAGFDEPLQEGAKAPLKALFNEKGLLAVRAIGPAILEDMVAYMRRRRASGDALAEAIGMYLLPQLEGLEQEQASGVYRKLQDSLAGWTSGDALAALRDQYREIFPHMKLPEA
ncbi:MAG: AAA family ATPase, partial [Myxococcales bacterium]|nr:AAA family ATPase [Myxococcales bacterium]